eukprot:5994383-Amphidinium_carterae.1
MDPCSFFATYAARAQWWWIVLFRVVNALLLTTYFQPDEQWQSLEVAHKWVFGYGHTTWEWDESVALR